jgi:hypothetical protein
MELSGKDQINSELSDMKDSVAAGDGSASGYPSANQPRSGIDEEIEKNLLIKTMPRRFKVSVPDKQKTKTKAVGAVIMIIGLIVMAAAVYLVYIFLINPQKTVAPVTNNKPVAPAAPVVKTEEPVVPPLEPEIKEAPVATTSPVVVQVPATTSEPIIPSTPATSTDAIVPTTTPSSSVVPVEPAAAIIDSDGDGLSDSEEALFGTNANLTDSDGDGFSDSAELENLYNPAGEGRLAVNLNIMQYKDDQKGYSVFRPAAWRVQNVGDSVIFSAPDNSFVQIVYEANSEKKGILLWYNEQFSDASASLSDVIIKNGWEGLYHRDNRIVYLADLAKNAILTISYVPSQEGDMTYYNVFRTMVSSFAIDAK